MSTITEKLNYLNETKSLIKQAIVDKGVDVSDSDTFRSYADKIDTISANNNIIDLNLPTNNGLVFWIDGQYNTRNGKDHTKTYMQNLVCTNPQATDTGYREYLQTSGNSWDGDFLTLGNYAFYPYIYNSTNLTAETLVMITKIPAENLIFISTGYNGGWYLLITPERQIRFGVRQGNSYVYVETDIVMELDTPYYIAATFEANNKIKIHVVNLDTVNAVASTSTMTYNLVNMAVGTQANTSTSASGKHWDGLKIGMIRIWNKTLSDEIINTNYLSTFKRFGIPVSENVTE